MHHFFAQESDTLGKDSELASTLAQGKPVITFVPEVDVEFAERLLGELRDAYPEKSDAVIILEQLQLFSQRAAWEDRTVRSWLDDQDRMSIEKAKARLQEAIQIHYDGRAKTLRESHPLGVQVNLATGVAKGVLVVRTVGDCARLVRRIVTRTLEFGVSEENGSTVLREVISNSVFRVATGDMMLSNAFWNFYLESSE